jgi:hypothetical protein
VLNTISLVLFSTLSERVSFCPFLIVTADMDKFRKTVCEYEENCDCGNFKKRRGYARIFILPFPFYKKFFLSPDLSEMSAGD